MMKDLTNYKELTLFLEKVSESIESVSLGCTGIDNLNFSLKLARSIGSMSFLFCDLKESGVES